MTFARGSSLAGALLTDNLSAGAEVVGRVVPTGYDRYARVFAAPSRGKERLRWAELLGVPPTFATTWSEIESVDETSTLTVPEGSLDELTSVGLISALRSSRVEYVNFGLWDGYADSQPYFDYPSCLLPPGRRTLLLRARLQSASVPVNDLPGARRLTRWWPDDLRWCVGSDLYSNSVIVGGTSAVIAKILKSASLEAVEVGVGDLVPDRF